MHREAFLVQSMEQLQSFFPQRTIFDNQKEYLESKPDVVIQSTDEMAEDEPFDGVNSDDLMVLEGFNTDSRSNTMSSEDSPQQYVRCNSIQKSKSECSNDSLQANEEIEEVIQ